jgi:DNA replication protein DnaC
MGVRVLSSAGGATVIETCECQLEQRVARLLHRAAIPERYRHCSFENFETSFPKADPSLATAQRMARQFVDGYPATTGGRGLIFTGSSGLGKTHLAVSILKALIADRGAHGLFCDYRELLKEIGHSYNRQVATTEMDVLRPVFDAEVLLLDELGATQPTTWIWDTVALILNSRYNKKLTTLFTSNFLDLPGAGPEPVGCTDGEMVERARRATREPTLGDRIGERMRSRLAEMCVTVPMNGQDFRQTVARARFG